MAYTVFFAYQSDIPSEFGQQFISKALKDASKKIKEKKKVEVKIEVGSRGTPGTPILIEEMLSKSRKADMVIVDLTFTSSKVWANAKKFSIGNREIRILKNVEDKPSPNPNVLLETGYAWAQKGFYRTLAIMNNAYGNPKNLPVDLKGFRWGITYNLNEKNYGEINNEREKTVEALYTAIANAINSDTEYQRDRYAPIRISKDWSPNSFRSKFFASVSTKKIISDLRTALDDSNNPQRILGGTKSGKTRLAYQLYRKIDSMLPEHENIEHVLFYDLKLGNYASIEAKLQQLKVLNQKKLLILDNCPIEVHDTVFSEYTAGTNVSLLTIDEYTPGNRGTISLGPIYSKEIVVELTNHRGRPELGYELWNKYEGNLSEIITVLGAIQPGQFNLPNDYLARWTQIIGQGPTNLGALRLLESLSLFSYIGFQGQYQKQSEFLIKFASIDSSDTFRNIVNHLLGKSLVKSVGDFILLETFDEELSAAKLQQMADQDIDLFLQSITDFNLVEPFSNKLTELSIKPNFKKPFKEIWRKSALFKNVNFLSTNAGGKILLSISETQPDLVLTTLEQVIEQHDSGVLFAGAGSRRYLVWSLERIVFRKEMFERAAEILFHFAEFENEQILNNATGQFEQLFQIGLPGTEASLKKRLDYITKLSQRVTSERGTSVIKGALTKALNNHGFIRMGASELQGGEQLKDYTPSPPEVLDYQAGVISLLLYNGMYDVLINQLPSLARTDKAKVILDAIEQIIKNNGSISDDLRLQLESIVNDENNYGTEIRKRVRLLIEKNTSDSVKDLFRFKVSLPAYSSFKDERGEIINRAKDNAEKLALELSNVDNWLSEINVLLNGEQRQTYNFGYALGQNRKSDLQLIKMITKELEEIPLGERNISLLIGYLQSQDEDFIREAISVVIQESSLINFAIRLYGLISIRPSDIAELKPIINAQPQLVIELENLKFKTYPIDQMGELIDWLCCLEPWGKSIALEICAGGFEKIDEIPNNIRIKIERLLADPGLLKGDENHKPYSLFDYIKLLKILSEKDLSEDIIEKITSNILDVTETIFDFNDFYFNAIFRILIPQYWQKVWFIISERMINPDYSGWYHLRQLLEQQSNLNEDDIVEWMSRYPQRAPQMVIDFIKLYEIKEGNAAWSPIMLKMINMFPENEELFDKISSKLHSFMWSGSLIPMFQERLQLAQSLSGNPSTRVRSWAEEEVKYFQARIEAERKNEENNSVRFK
ncbi:hypothetical protein [Chitinophaga flava]|uniref:Uncharacterized protein n=1 Tax=Chitinophaga flava TaxID=2259036 RepID=A0A365XVP8_9BACT|nr:hypothetical protein [Chitinophaga flava]RBL90447.1 hypothetical protein DF182_28725 [Chitinophaga flava]